MATISKLRLKPEWEKWLVEHSHHALADQSPSAPTPEVRRSDRRTSGVGGNSSISNEVLWMAIKRQWRARLRAQQLPQAGQDVQGQD